MIGTTAPTTYRITVTLPWCMFGAYTPRKKRVYTRNSKKGKPRHHAAKHYAVSNNNHAISCQCAMQSMLVTGSQQYRLSPTQQEKETTCFLKTVLLFFKSSALGQQNGALLEPWMISQASTPYTMTTPLEMSDAAHNTHVQGV